MPPTPPRRFTVADGLIVVAGTALGIWLMRLWGFDQIPEALSNGWQSLWDHSYPEPWAFLLDVARAARDFTGALLAATLTLTCLNLRQPRPRLRRLAR